MLQNQQNISVNSRYPFGMIMPGRSKSSPDYRYGFQGQEMDNEIKSNGNSLNYKYRMHDPRVGRFFAVDPLAGKYPYNSPYAFSENRVVDGVELEGLEFTKHWNKDNVATRAKYLMDNPEAITQTGGTCVIAAITYLWIKQDREGFYEAMMSLYDKGIAKYGSFTINPDSHLENFDPSKAKSSGEVEKGSYLKASFKNGTKGADWIMISSIQDTKNSFYDFEGLSTKGEGHKDKGAGTSRGVRLELMQDLLGYNDIQSSYFSSESARNAMNVAETFADLNSKVSDGYSILLTIDANMLFNTKTGKYAGHAVTYLGQYRASIKGGVISHTFRVQTWGSKKWVTVSDDDFKKYYRGYDAGKTTDTE